MAAVACVTREDGGERAPAGLRFDAVADGAAVTDAASTGGVSWVDFDNDGDLDLCVTNGYDVTAPEAVPQQNRLYRNDGGALTPVTGGDFAAGEGFSSGNTWGDYDNDGDPDLYVANQRNQPNFLYRNDGEGGLKRITGGVAVADSGSSFAAGWVDVDRDGWLDLFVANGGLGGTGANRLYRNLGDGGFEKITAGEIVTDESMTCGFAWGDYDNDGDADLYVANNGFNPAINNNALYRNDGNWTFTKITGSPAVEDQRPSCSADWVDCDGDGDLDLYVANLYGFANLLYINDGSGGFEAVTGEPVAVEGGNSFVANWEDYDNDGDVDLLLGNWGAGPDLYLNDGSGGFERARAGDISRSALYGATMASADYDGDGDVDVYIGNWPNQPGPGEPNCLYVNRGTPGNWLQVQLEGRESNRSGIGARITVTVRMGDGTRTQLREVTAHNGFRSQSGLVKHFGLGRAASADEVVVTWPSGKRSTLEGVEANQRITITE
jgi:hypothetical protein